MANGQKIGNMTLVANVSQRIAIPQGFRGAYVLTADAGIFVTIGPGDAIASSATVGIPLTAGQGLPLSTGTLQLPYLAAFQVAGGGVVQVWGLW